MSDDVKKYTSMYDIKDFAQEYIEHFSNKRKNAKRK